MENWQAVFDFLATLNLPWLAVALQIVGTLVIVASSVDKLLTKIDFMSKIMAIPILGSLLNFLTKFSIFAPVLKEEDKVKRL